MITLISGTNRAGSQTLRVTEIFAKLYREAGAQIEHIDLADLPPTLFTPEAYAKKPADFLPFSSKILASDGLVVFTPEYNGSFPGVLKYFIDMLPFPESFENRPVAFVGLAAGYFGALRSVEQLELIFRYRNAFVFNERVLLPHVESQITESGDFSSPLIKKLAHSQVKNFVSFCRKMKE